MAMIMLFINSLQETRVCLTKAWLTVFFLSFVTKGLCLTSKLGKHLKSSKSYMYKHSFVSTPENADFAHQVPL